MVRVPDSVRRPRVGPVSERVPSGGEVPADWDAVDINAEFARIADREREKARMRRFLQTGKDDAAPVLRTVEVNVTDQFVSVVPGVARMLIDDRERLRLLDAEGGVVAVFGDGMWCRARFRAETYSLR